MKPPGSFKINKRRARSGGLMDPLGRTLLRSQRVVDSLRVQIAEGGPDQTLRIRQVFQHPRELYRLELELPELAFQRTTLLDRDALEELLMEDDVRLRVGASTLEG